MLFLLFAQVASAAITWTSCPDVNAAITSAIGIQGAPFDCANLTVPLDYTDPNSQPLTLNLFKLNATKTPVLGSVIVNFGGPGGPGAENIPYSGPLIAQYVGPQFDIISWDPRGTGKTIPFDCKIPGLAKRDTLATVNLTQIFERDGWDTAGSLADACFAAMNDTGRFISTASTARDVINIAEALDEPLRYWGWSYGTALGAYLAAIYPDKIERMVLDGNLNPYDYQSGTYRTTATDIDKAFQGFLKECLANNCSLAANATTTDDIVATLNQAVAPAAAKATDVLSFLQGDPIPALIIEKMYYPAQWPELSDTLSAILNGTYTPKPTPKDTYDLGNPWSAYGIRGADAIWPPTRKEYLPEVEFENTIGPFKSSYIAPWVSARWKITPKDRYKGGFNTTTRTPILLVNGEYDPVTPIVNAYNASGYFAGSVVLAHTGYGHGIVVDPSACVQNYTNAYFLTGNLPPNGTVCNPDMSPWELAKAMSSNGTSGTNGTSTSSPTGSATGSAATSSPTPGAASSISAMGVSAYLLALYSVFLLF